MSTDPVHVEDDTADPTPLHTDLGHVSNSDLTFDQHLEAIDQGLLKFDHPIQVSPITLTPHYLPPSQPVSPHHHQDVDTLNLIPIPSEPPLINSTHTSNQNISSTQKSPPYSSHISSWKKILKATVAHTHNLSTLSGSKHALNEDQPKLPSKRHAVSQVVEEHKLILAEVGYQPCQRQ